jgi:acetyl-CoA acyltransferase
MASKPCWAAAASSTLGRSEPVKCRIASDHDTNARICSAGTPSMRVHTSVVAGDEKALRRAGLAIGDIGGFEVNEAYASVVLAWLAETGADPARVNPRGGAIALGHPLGASGVRFATTLLHHMRDNGIRYGLQTMCQAAGLANATIYELL